MMRHTPAWLPLGTRVLVRPIRPDPVTPGGILIPDRVDLPDVQGIVVAIGTAVRDVTLGDHVLFPSFVGLEMKQPDGVFLMLDEIDLLAVVAGADDGTCPLCGHSEEGADVDD